MIQARKHPCGSFSLLHSKTNQKQTVFISLSTQKPKLVQLAPRNSRPKSKHPHPPTTSVSKRPTLPARTKIFHSHGRCLMNSYVLISRKIKEQPQQFQIFGKKRETSTIRSFSVLAVVRFKPKDDFKLFSFLSEVSFPCHHPKIKRSSDFHNKEKKTGKSISPFSLFFSFLWSNFKNIKKKSVRNKTFPMQKRNEMKNYPIEMREFPVPLLFLERKRCDKFFFFFLFVEERKTKKKIFLFSPSKKFRRKPLRDEKKKSEFLFPFHFEKIILLQMHQAFRKQKDFSDFVWIWKPEPESLSDRIMLKWSWTSPLLTIHNLVSQNWSSAKDPRASLIECLFPIKQNCSYLPDYRFDRLSDQSPELCVNRGALFSSLVSMDSGLEAFSRYPTHGSFSALSCRSTEFTNYANQRFLSYWIGLLSRRHSWSVG